MLASTPGEGRAGQEPRKPNSPEAPAARPTAFSRLCAGRLQATAQAALRPAGMGAPLSAASPTYCPILPPLLPPGCHRLIQFASHPVPCGNPGASAILRGQVGHPQ